VSNRKKKIERKEEITALFDLFGGGDGGAAETFSCCCLL
jgi:hypothetical protein